MSGADGHVRKRGNAYEWRKSYVDDLGKRRTLTGTAPTMREAQAALRKAATAIASGQIANDPDRLTTGKYLDRWLVLSRANVRASTWERYQAMTNNYLKPAIGAIPLSKLRPLHIEEAFARWAEGGRLDGRPGPLAGSTRSLLHVVLTVALNRAVKLELLARNPALVTSKPRKDTAKVKALTVEQCQQVLEEARGTVYYWPLALAFNCGTRRGECLALRWRNVDLAAGAITIEESVAQLRSGAHVGPTKTRSSVRRIALPPAFAEELRGHWKARAEVMLGLGARLTGDDLVCCWLDGTMIRPKSLTQFCLTLFRRLGLKATFHTTRHSHASILLSSGANVKAVQQRLGHASARMTLDTYSHLLGNEDEQTAEIIGKALSVSFSGSKSS
ncbi:MAG TPA: site-specific integrase [Stellaceae bacterium]|nr:site-specific integrase [Stellaceae bacterium]